MSVFVPEYTVLAIALLIFGYHALKELGADEGSDAHEAKKHQRTSKNTGR
jgi:Sec-independent protein translocase protein TatA